MNLRTLTMEDVAHALGHVTVIPEPVHNYVGMTAGRADDLNAAVRDLGRDEAVRLLCIMVERCALYRDSTPLTELWDARLTDAKTGARIAAIAARLRGVA